MNAKTTQDYKTINEAAVQPTRESRTIAKAIRANTARVWNREISRDQHSAMQRHWWDRAEELGCSRAVAYELSR